MADLGGILGGAAYLNPLLEPMIEWFSQNGVPPPGPQPAPTPAQPAPNPAAQTPQPIPLPQDGPDQSSQPTPYPPPSQGGVLGGTTKPFMDPTRDRILRPEVGLLPELTGPTSSVMAKNDLGAELWPSPPQPRLPGVEQMPGDMYTKLLQPYYIPDDALQPFTPDTGGGEETITSPYDEQGTGGTPNTTRDAATAAEEERRKRNPLANVTAPPGPEVIRPTPVSLPGPKQIDIGELLDLYKILGPNPQLPQLTSLLRAAPQRG